MHSSLRTFGLSVGLAILLLAIFRPAFAQSPPDSATTTDPAEFPKVRVEPVTGGATIEGKLKLAAITLKTDFGSTTIGMAHVRRITFPIDPEGKSSDLVQLADRSILRGRVTTEQFVLKTDVGETTMKKIDVRELRMVRDEQLPLFAILLGLLTLVVMEIILGIDNVIFLAIVVGKLPEAQRPRARKFGLSAALGTRILLLFSLSFLLGLTTPIFTLPDLPFLHDVEAREVSWRDLILLAGGLFLIGKSVREMHEKIENARTEQTGSGVPTAGRQVSFVRTIVTIATIDVVFSLDSVITAIGMVEQIWVMVVAMVLAMLVMLYFAGPISTFVDRHPTIKVLALSFLILIGVMLVAEGLGQHVDKGYVYAAMSFAFLIELINMQLRKPPKKTTTA